MRIPAVRLLDSTPAMIRAFAYRNVSLFLCVPNPLVPVFALNRSVATHWVHSHVLPFYLYTKISIISVGNDALSDSPDVSPFLLRAMQNLRRSLKEIRIYKISVSTTFSFSSIIPNAFPPSSARFQQPNGEVILRPILRFLEKTNSPFLINLYPYIYKSTCSSTIGFALFDDSALSVTTDPSTRVRYRSLFHVMYDALVMSLGAMGHGTLPIIISETGWPSSGNDAGDVDATFLYSTMFLSSLNDHLKNPSVRKEGPLEVYIFEFVDNEQGVRRWGLLYQNLTAKYRRFSEKQVEAAVAILKKAEDYCNDY
ncbi:unnamed protein product [Microthlaspi erraticum]|uniref:glucan endo-1,3-beta-D-glucosidase n=1 Tax=Microthlaspi erraticum TaxID=1685480 RepID=A0A6D2KUW9_9BRAS|nr:unnamed protein product [Microthlaspi erraticum]